MKLLIFFISSIFMSIAWTADISLVMNVDKTQLSLEDELQVQVAVEGVRSYNGEIAIQGSNLFQVRDLGSSSQMQIINGAVTSKVIYNYAMYPKKEGEFVLGPAEIKVDGKAYRSNVVKLNVSKAGVTKKKSDSYYIETFVDNPTPYVGEQTVFTFRFLNRSQISGANLEQFPEFEGFWKEELGEQREYQKIINGVRWNVTEIQTALFPTRAGEITIDQTILVANVLQKARRNRRRQSIFGSFFDMAREAKRVRLRAAPVKLNVRALPAGAPANFSGLIGSFRVASGLSKNRMSVGESSTLTIKVEGKGNIQGTKIPLPEFENFKIYEDKPQTKTFIRDDSLWSSKTIKMALVPQKEGVYSLPPFELVYFDTEKGEYLVTKTGPISLQITPGDGEEKLELVTGTAAQTEIKRKIKVLGEDLRPIRRDILTFKSEEFSLEQIVYTVNFLVVMPILFIIMRLVKRRREMLEADSGLARRQKAFKNFITRYKKLKFGSDFVEVTSNILRQYVGDKLGSDGMAMTSIDVERQLGDQQVSSQLIERIKVFLKTCEMGTYGGVTFEKTRKREHMDNLNSIVRKLEKELR